LSRDLLAPCEAQARGRLKVPGGGGAPAFKLRPASAQLPADEETPLRLEIKPKARTAAREALRAGRRVTAKVRVTARAGELKRMVTERVRVKP
jgi:hypothetical protein